MTKVAWVGGKYLEEVRFAHPAVRVRRYLALALITLPCIFVFPTHVARPPYIMLRVRFCMRETQ